MFEEQDSKKINFRIKLLDVKTEELVIPSRSGKNISSSLNLKKF